MRRLLSRRLHGAHRETQAFELLGGQGRLIRPPEEIVRAHAVIIARAADELEPRLARAVFIVAQKCLTDVQIRRHGALREPLGRAKRLQPIRKAAFQRDRPFVE